MKVTKWETLYHEGLGATLKHKCGKRIVALSLLSFSLIFLFFLFFYLGLFSFLWPLFLVKFEVSSPLLGESMSPSSFPHLGQCSNNDDHHTFYFYYNSTITTRYLEQSMTLYECPGGILGYAMNHEWHVWKNYERWLCHKYDVNYMIMQSNMTMMERVIIKGMVESCMEIYLGMAMEMP